MNDINTFILSNKEIIIYILKSNSICQSPRVLYIYIYILMLSKYF